MGVKEELKMQLPQSVYTNPLIHQKDQGANNAMGRCMLNLLVGNKKGQG